MVDDEMEDPDFSPGEEEEEPESEEVSLEAEEGSSGDVSDTNAPYADAEDEQPAAASTRRGTGRQYDIAAQQMCGCIWWGLVTSVKRSHCATILPADCMLLSRRAAVIGAAAVVARLFD